MRSRAVQLACLVLLLSSLGAAHGTQLRPGELSAHYRSVLRAHEQVAGANEYNGSAPRAAATVKATSLAFPARLRAALPMRPAAAHAAMLYARTSAA